MGDVYVEWLVKKKLGPRELLACGGIVLGAMALVVLSMYVCLYILLFPQLSVLITAGACWGGYKLLCTQLLEFEYSLTNGYVTVDKIIHKASRKRLAAFELDTCSGIGLYQENAQRLKEEAFDTRLFACRHSDGQGAWYLSVRGGKTGKTLVVFDPSEEFLEAVKKFLPRALRQAPGL